MSFQAQPQSTTKHIILQQIHDLQQQQAFLDQELEASLNRTANLEFSLEFLLHNNTQLLHHIQNSTPDPSFPSPNVLQNLPPHYSLEYFQQQASNLRSESIDSSKQLANYIQDLDRAQTISSQTLSRVDHIVTLVSLNHEIDAYSDHILSEDYLQLLAFQGDINQYPENIIPLNLAPIHQFITLLNKSISLQDIIFDSLIQLSSTQHFKQNNNSQIASNALNASNWFRQQFSLNLLHSDKVLHLYTSKSIPLLKLHLLRNYSTILSSIHHHTLENTNQSSHKCSSLILTSIPKDVLSILYSISTTFLKIKSPHLALLLYVNVVLITLENSVISNDLHYTTLPEAAQVSYLDLVSHITTLTTNVIQSHLKAVRSIFGFGGLIYMIHILTEYTNSILTPLLYRMLSSWQLDSISPSLYDSLPLFKNAQTYLNTLNKQRHARNSTNKLTSKQSKNSTLNPQGYDIQNISNIVPIFHLPSFVSLSYSPQYPASQITQQAQRDYNTKVLHQQHMSSKEKITQSHSAYKNQSYLSSGFNYLSGLVTSTKEHSVAAGNIGLRIDQFPDSALQNEPFPLISPSTLWPETVTYLLKELDDKLEQCTAVHRVLDSFIVFINDLTSVVVKQFVSLLEKDYITFHQGICNTWFSTDILSNEQNGDQTGQTGQNDQNDQNGQHNFFTSIVDKFIDYTQHNLIQSTTPPQINQQLIQSTSHHFLPKLYTIFKASHTQPVKVDRFINLLDATITNTPRTATIVQPDIMLTLFQFLTLNTLFSTTMYSFLNLISPTITNLLQYYIQNSPALSISIPTLQQPSSLAVSLSTRQIQNLTSTALPPISHLHTNIHLLNYLHHTSPILYTNDLHLITAVYPSLNLAQINAHHNSTTSPAALQIASNNIEHLTQIFSYYKPTHHQSSTTSQTSHSQIQINPFLNTFFTSPSSIKASKSTSNNTSNIPQLPARKLILSTHSLREFLQDLSNIYILFEQIFLSSNISKACAINNAFKGSVGFEFYLPQLSRITFSPSTTLTRSMFLNLFVNNKQGTSMVGNNPKIAQYTDDCFYLLMKCIKRALYSSNIDTVLGLINISMTFLQDKICLYAVSQLLPYLQTIAMQGRYTKELLNEITSLHSSVAEFAPSLAHSNSNPAPNSSDSTQIIDYNVLLMKSLNTDLNIHVSQQNTFQHRLMEILLACDGRTGLLIDHSFQEILTKNYKEKFTKDQKDHYSGALSPTSGGGGGITTHPAGIQPAVYYTVGNIYTVANTYPSSLLQQLFLFYTEVSFLFGINNIDHLATQCINLYTYLVQLFEDYFGDDDDEDDEGIDHATHQHPPTDTASPSLQQDKKIENPLLTQYNSMIYQQTQRKSLFTTIGQLFDVSNHFSKFVKLSIQVHINRLIIRLKSKFDGFLVHDYSITDLSSIQVQPQVSSPNSRTAVHQQPSGHTTPGGNNTDDSILSSVTSNIFRSFVDNQFTEAVSSTSSALLSLAAMGLSTTSCTTGQQVSNWVIDIFLLIQQEIRVYLPCFTSQPLTWYLLAVVQYLSTRLYRLLIGNQIQTISNYFQTQLGSTLYKALRKKTQTAASKSDSTPQISSSSPNAGGVGEISDNYSASNGGQNVQRVTINPVTNMVTIDQIKTIPMFSPPQSHHGSFTPGISGNSNTTGNNSNNIHNNTNSRNSETDLTFTLLGGLQFDTDLRWLLSALLSLLSSEQQSSSSTSSSAATNGGTSSSSLNRTHGGHNNSKDNNNNAFQSLDYYLDSTTINTLTLHVKEKFSKLLQSSYVLQSSTLYEVDMMVQMELYTNSSSSNVNNNDQNNLLGDSSQHTSASGDKKEQIDAVLQWFFDHNNTNDDDQNNNSSSLGNQMNTNTNWKLTAKEMYCIATLRCDFTMNDWAMLQERLVDQFLFQP